MPASRIPTEPVESSNLAALGYDLASHTLAVEFKSGHVHHHLNVPAEIAIDLRAADSKGKFYAQFIKGKFPSTKMTGSCAACGDIGWIGEECTDCGTQRYTPIERVSRDSREHSAQQCGCDPGANYKCADHGGTHHWQG